MFLVLMFGLAGIFADVLAPYNPTANDFRGDDRAAELGASGSAPTSSGAICCPASCSARAPLSSSA